MQELLHITHGGLCGRHLKVRDLVKPVVDVGQRNSTNPYPTTTTITKPATTTTTVKKPASTTTTVKKPKPTTTTTTP